MGFKQTFHHTPSKKVDVTSLIRKKIESDEQISDFDLEIIKIIDSMKFLTAEMVADVLGEDKDKVERRLSKLVRNKVINSFLLSSIKYVNRSEIPDDAEYIYTMDYAGSVLIDKFIINKFEEWQCKDAALNPISIGKILISNELFVKVKKSVGEKIKSYIVAPEYPIDKYMMASDFEMTLTKDTENDKIFLGEVINNSYDRYNVIKTLEKFENFIATESYTKVYKAGTAEPIFIFICEDEDVLEDISNILEGLFPKIKLYRLTTIERLKGDIGGAEAFLKYDRNIGGLKASGIKMFKK